MKFKNRTRGEITRVRDQKTIFTVSTAFAAWVLNNYKNDFIIINKIYLNAMQ